MQRGFERTRVHFVLSLLLCAACPSSWDWNAADEGRRLGCAEDVDRDGYGLGCAKGPDCNDFDALTHADCAPCAVPTEGCECEPGAKPVACFEQSLSDAETMLCEQGTRSCENGRWSKCDIDNAFEVDVADRREQNGGIGGIAQALVPSPPGTTPCSDCQPDCFPVTDQLNAGGLSSQNSINAVDTTGGITVEHTEVIQTITSTTTCVPNVCIMPGDDTICDDDCDGIPNAYDLAKDNKPFGTTATAIFMDLAIGEYENATIDLAFYVRTADVYFLIDATSGMSDEITQLTADMQTGSFLADDRECGDIDRDGSTADEEVLKMQGIAGNIVCRLRDGYIGMGYFREIPFSSAGDNKEIAFQHLVDLGNDHTELQTAIGDVSVDANPDDAMTLGNSQMLAMYLAATGNEAYFGWNRPGIPQRTTCTLGTWGYPCFRDAAFPIMVMVTDSRMHNGPGSAACTGTDLDLADSDECSDASDMAGCAALDALADLTCTWTVTDPAYPYNWSDLDNTVNAGSAPVFTSADVGRLLSISDATNVANNGQWLITAATNYTLTYANASGVTGAYTGPYTILNRAGTGDGIAVSGTSCVLTDAAGAFSAADVDKRITVAGATNPVNNGNWRITAVTATTVTYANTACAAEAAFPGSWKITNRTGYAQNLEDLGATTRLSVPIDSHHYFHPTQIRDSSEADPYDLDNPLPFDGNDLITDAFNVGSINGLLATYVGDLRGMTADPDFATTMLTCGAQTGVVGPDAFYKFSVDTKETLTVSTRGSRVPTVLGIFTTIPGSSTGGSVDWGDLDFTDMTGDADTEYATLPDIEPGVHAVLNDAMVETSGSLPREVAANECYDGSSETNQGNSGNNSSDYGSDLMFHFQLSTPAGYIPGVDPIPVPEPSMDLTIWADDTGENMSLSLFRGLPRVPETLEIDSSEVTVDLPDSLNAWRMDGSAPGAYRLVGEEDDGDDPPDEIITTGSQPVATIAGAPFRNFRDENNVASCGSVANDTAKGLKINFEIEEDPLDPTRKYDIAIETNGDGNGLDIQKQNGNAQIYHAIGLSGSDTTTSPDTAISAPNTCEDQATVCTLNAATDLGAPADAGWIQISGSFDAAPSFTADIPGTWLDNRTTSGAASSCDGSAAGYDMVYKLVVDQTRTLDFAATAPVSYLSLHNSSFATATATSATQSVSAIPTTPSLETAITGIGADGTDTLTVDFNKTGIGDTSSGGLITKTLGSPSVPSALTFHDDTSSIGAIDREVQVITGSTGTGDKEIPRGNWASGSGCATMSSAAPDVLIPFTVTDNALVKLTSNAAGTASTVYAAIFDTTGTIVSGCVTSAGNTVNTKLTGGATYILAVSSTTTGSSSENRAYSLTLRAENYWLKDGASDAIDNKYIAFSGSTTNASADVSRTTFGGCIGGTMGADTRTDVLHVFRVISQSSLQVESVDADTNFDAVAGLFEINPTTGVLGTRLSSTSGSSCLAEGTTNAFSVTGGKTYALVVSTTGPASGLGSTGNYLLRVRSPDPPTAAETYELDTGGGNMSIGATSSNHVTLSGSTLGRLPNVSLGCGGSTPGSAQSDILHVFAIPASFDGVVRVANTSSSADAFTSIAKLYTYDRTSAAVVAGVTPMPGSGATCITEGTTSSYRLRNSTASEAYYAIVVSNGSAASATTAGSYSLQLLASMSSESAETYTLASALDSRYVELQGTTANRSSDYSTFASGCVYSTPTSAQSDVAHVFTLTGSSSNLTLTNVANGSSVNSVASLFRVDTGTLQTPSSGSSCIAEGTSATFNGLASGTYRLVVSAANGESGSSGYGGYSGAYTIRALAVPAAAGEGHQLAGTSPTPADRIDGKSVVITGSTAGRLSGGVTRANFSGGSGTCVGGGSSTSTNADVVHTFTVNSSTTLRLKLTGSGGFSPVAGLFKGTGVSLGTTSVGTLTAITPNSGSTDNCIAANESVQYTVTAGTYAVAVSAAAAGASGGYTIELTSPDQDATGGLVKCGQGNETAEITGVTLTAGTYYLVAKAKDLTTTSRGNFTIDIYDRTAASSGAFSLIHCVECANQSTAGCINDSTNGGKHVTTRMVLEDLEPGTYTAIIRPTSGSDEPRLRVLIRDLDYLPLPVELSNGEPACHNTRQGGNDPDDFSLADLPVFESDGVTKVDYYLLLRRFNDEPLDEPMDFSVHIVNNEPPTSSTAPSYCSGAVNGDGFGEITAEFQPGLTYYAVVKGVASDDAGWYNLSVGRPYDNTTGASLEETDDVPNVTWSGTYGATTVASVKTALNDRDIRVIGVNPSTDAVVTSQLESIAVATDATRLDGEGLVASGVTPTTLSQKIVQLVEELSFSTQSDVSVQLLKFPDDPYGTVDDFDFYVEALDSVGDGAADGCEDVADTIDDMIDRPDTHLNCTASATPQFRVTFGNPEDAPVDCKCDVDPTHADCDGWNGTDCLGWSMTLQLVADNQYIVEQIPVYIIPRDVAPEPNYTEYDPSGSYWQDFGSPNCTDTETTDWNQFEWSLKLPTSPGASVSWQVCTSDTPFTSTTTCNLTTVATVTTDGMLACSTSADCPNGMCVGGQCQYVRGPACGVDRECGNGSCIGGQCMWTSLPLDVGDLLPTTDSTRPFMRVRTTMVSSTDLRSAPEVYEWTVRYQCVSNE
jgi:hypothetical protein